MLTSELTEVIKRMGEYLIEHAEGIASDGLKVSTARIELKGVIRPDAISYWDITYRRQQTKGIWITDRRDRNDNSDNSRSNTDNDKQYNDNVDDSEHNE